MIRTNQPPHPQATAEKPAGYPGDTRQDPRRDPFHPRDSRERALRDGLGRDGLGRDSLGREDRSGTGEGFGRSLAFGERMRDAMGDTGRDPGRDPGQGEEHRDGRERRREDEPRLLAAVEPEPVAALFGAAPPAPAVPAREALPAGPGTAELVARLSERLEAAIRAELSAGAGQTLSLRVPLDGLVPGLAAVTVALTPAGLDVTLVRAAGLAPADLADAARDLAHRLRGRFGGRGVRVLERTEAAEPPAGDALAAIGRLLGRADP